MSASISSSAAFSNDSGTTPARTTKPFSAYPVDRLREMKERHLAHAPSKEWCSETEAQQFARMLLTERSGTTPGLEDLLPAWMGLVQENTITMSNSPELDEAEARLRSLYPDSEWSSGFRFTTSAPEFGDNTNEYEVRLVDRRLRYRWVGGPDWKPKPVGPRSDVGQSS